MSDSYQAIFDAVRSRITNGDVGSAVESAMNNANIGHYFQMAANFMTEQFADYSRPSAIYRPRLAKDGNAWIACYGDNLAEGVVGCGDTPEKAMRDFDKNWYAP